MAIRENKRSEKDGNIRRYVKQREILVSEAVGAKRTIVVYVSRPVIEVQEILRSHACKPVAYCVERQCKRVMTIEKT
jgi:uncharacterized protein (DUF2344 family)